MSAPARTLTRGRATSAVRRSDAVPKVTGEFAYSSDLHAAGMLWGQTVRSPHAHARIIRTDVSDALMLHAIALRSSVRNAAFSHELRNVGTSDGSAGRPAREAGLWEWPSAK